MVGDGAGELLFCVDLLETFVVVQAKPGEAPLKGDNLMGEPTGERQALIKGGSLAIAWGDVLVLMLLVLTGLFVGVEVMGGEGRRLNDEELTGETEYEGDERVVVLNGVNGELLEGLLGGEHGGDLTGDFFTTPSPLIDEKLKCVGRL